MAEPDGLGRALILRVCGDFTKDVSFCVCNKHLHNVPVDSRKDEYATKACIPAKDVPGDPAKLVPENFPNMDEGSAVQFLFVTLFGDAALEPFCPFDKLCKGDLIRWTPATWRGVADFRLASFAAVVAAIYGRDECLRGEHDAANAGWISDLKNIEGQSRETGIDRDLEKLRMTQVIFGGESKSAFAAGCTMRFPLGELGTDQR